jgi:hypothetical protein
MSITKHLLNPRQHCTGHAPILPIPIVQMHVAAVGSGYLHIYVIAAASH